MDLSEFLYEVSIEVRDLQKDERIEKGEMGEDLFNLLKTVEKTNFELELKNENMKIFEKQMRKTIQKNLNSMTHTTTQIDNIKKEIKVFIEKIKDLKEMHEKLLKEKSDKREKIDANYNTMVKKITDKIDFDPLELDQLEKENEDLQKLLKDKINEYELSENLHSEKLQRLQDDYTKMQEHTSKKMEEFQHIFDEMKKINEEKHDFEIKNNKMKNSMMEINQKISEYKKMIKFKKEQYLNYQKDIREMIDKTFLNHQKKTKREDLNKDTNNFYLSIITENDQMNKQLREAEKKTEILKEKCKKLQKELFDKNKKQ